MKNLAFYSSFLMLITLLTSCEKEEAPVQDSIWQVYEENSGARYEGSESLVGKMAIPVTLLEEGKLPGSYTTITSNTSGLRANITKGILSINFPETLSLSNEFSSDHTDGVRISVLSMLDTDFKNSRVFELALVKRVSSSSFSKVYIYYLDEDFTYKASDGPEIQFKAGWNFCNHNYGIISQDINDFFNQGFRWRRIILARF